MKHILPDDRATDAQGKTWKVKHVSGKPVATDMWDSLYIEGVDHPAAMTVDAIVWDRLMRRVE